MNFRQLEVFYAVMINGTVTAAAHRLGVSQPSVTTTLQQAEARLGIPLFQRASGRLIPTDEARQLFEEVSRAHDALAAVNIMAKGMKLGRGGHVRVASVPTIALELLPDAIALFEARHTGFQFSVSTMNTEEIEEQLSDSKGAFNLGFTFGVRPESSLATTPIGRVHVRAVIPSSWKLPKGDRIDLVELADRPYVAGYDHTALGLEAQRLFRESNIEPNIVARCHSHQLAGFLVQRELGFSLLDNLTIRALLQGARGDGIVVRSLVGAKDLPIAAAYPGGQQPGNAASIFIECFQQAFEQLVRRARS